MKNILFLALYFYACVLPAQQHPVNGTDTVQTSTGKQIEHYAGGVPHGEWRFYDKEGRLTRVEHYEKGLLQGGFTQHSYQEKRKFTVVGHYVDGIEDGLFKFFTNGKPVSSFYKKAGDAHGPYERYDTLTGKVVEKGNFDKGGRTGEWTTIHGKETCKKVYYHHRQILEECAIGKQPTYRAESDSTSSIQKETWWKKSKRSAEIVYYGPYRFISKWDKKGRLITTDTTTSYNQLPDVEDPMEMGPPDTAPELVGGQKELREYLDKHLVYPPQAIELKVEGTVYVSFMVNTDGKVKDAQVTQSPDQTLNAEALRLVRGLPLLVPAIKGGFAVPARMIVPISFRLR